MAERWSAALPDDPLSIHATGPRPRARLGAATGLLTVADVRLEPADAVPTTATLAEVAERMRRAAAGLVPVVDGAGRLAGAVHLDDLLARVAAGRAEATAGDAMSALCPACRPEATLVDAVRVMLDAHVRRLPIVDDDGRLLGQLPLAEAVAHAARDPAVADLLASMALSPSLWARRWK